MTTQLTVEKCLTNSEYDETMRLLTLYQDKNPRDTTLLKLLLHTGARANEILNVRPIDLDHQNQKLFIRGLKNSNDRNLPIPDDLFKRLANLIDPTKPSTERIFPFQYNRLRAIWFHYRPVKKKVHCLRHTAGIRVYEKTKNILSVKLVLGHRSIQNTMIYLEYYESDKQLMEALL